MNQLYAIQMNQLYIIQMNQLYNMQYMFSMRFQLNFMS